MIVPEGWKLVPIEPDAAMNASGLEAYRDTFEGMHERNNAAKIYRAMLAAAPEPPLQGKENG